LHRLASCLLASVFLCVAILFAVAAGAGGVARATRPEDVAARTGQGGRVAVLTYHDIVESNPTSKAQISADDFAAQMRYLYANGYRVLSLDEFVSCHREGRFPDKAVLLTFDDGYRSFLEHARPVLKRYGFDAVVFPVVSYVPGLERRLVWVEHMTFHEIRSLLKEGGVDVGSHTYDLHHYEMGRPAVVRKEGEDPTAYRRRIERDLRVSKELLELQTDATVEALAWPYGRATSVATELGKEVGYEFFFTVRRGFVTPDTPADDIPRLPVTEGSLESFEELLEHGGTYAAGSPDSGSSSGGGPQGDHAALSRLPETRVPEHILAKPAELTPEEYEEVKNDL